MAPAGTLDFRILGPFEVLSDGRPVPLGPGKERVLLAVLLLYRNERVSVDRLVDLLWDESPPESAPKMVQIYVSRLRRRLGRNERLTTQAAGSSTLRATSRALKTLRPVDPPTKSPSSRVQRRAMRNDSPSVTVSHSSMTSK